MNTSENIDVVNRSVPSQMTQPIDEVERSKPPKPSKNVETYAKQQFLASHLADHFGLSKVTIYDQINAGGIKPSGYLKKGNTSVALYGWDAVHTLSDRYKERVGRTGVPRIVTAANMKGGTGKSTIATQVAMTAAIGCKVLVIDLDPQMHASKCLFFDDADLQKVPTLRDVIMSDLPVRDAVYEITPFLSIIPSNLRLSRLELEMYPLHNRENLIKTIIKNVAKDFDLVIIDTNPSASLINVSAIAASDEVWIITETDHLSTEGLATVFDVLKSIHKSFNHCPKIKIIGNQFDVRQGMAREAVGLLQSHFSDVLVPTIVNQCQDIREAQKRKQAIWQYNRKSVGSKDIFALTRNLLGIKGL